MRDASHPAGRARSRIAVFAALLGLALLAPTAALGDSLALSVSPEPVASVASQITWSATSEEGRYTVIAVNNPGIPCAADPAADDGQTLTPAHLFEGGDIGSYGGSVNYTPPSSGAYTACGWLEVPAGLLEGDGGPVTAAASLPLAVRAPHIRLTLSFPRHPEPRHSFTLDLLASAEASREVVVEGFPLTARRCPVNSAAEEEAPHLIDQEVDGGPWRYAANVQALRAGSYIFCAWAQPQGDELDPEATTQLVLHLTAPKRKTSRNGHEARL